MAGRLRRLYVGGDQARTRWRLHPVKYGANKWGLRPDHFGARVPGAGAKFRELTRKPLTLVRGGSLRVALKFLVKLGLCREEAGIYSLDTEKLAKVVKMYKPRQKT